MGKRFALKAGRKAITRPNKLFNAPCLQPMVTAFRADGWSHSLHSQWERGENTTRRLKDLVPRCTLVIGTSARRGPIHQGCLSGGDLREKAPREALREAP
ncbi:hypothetical protein ACOMHN_053648 [Nucella lapillus]